MTTCPETYERDADGLPERGTHRCDLQPFHDGAHHCPVCGSNWIDRVSP